MVAKIQAVASGCLPDIATDRQAVAASEAQDIFELGDPGYWDDAFTDPNGSNAIGACPFQHYVRTVYPPYFLGICDMTPYSPR